MNELDEIMQEENVEVEADVIETKIPKGAIIAGVAGAAIAVGAGIKWLIGKLRDTNPNYVYPGEGDFDDEIIGVDEGIVISEEE